MAKNKTKKIIVAGSLVVEALYSRAQFSDSPKVRAAKQRASSEAQARMNRKQRFPKPSIRVRFPAGVQLSAPGADAGGELPPRRSGRHAYL